MNRLSRDLYRLSTGRTISANHGLISISTQRDPQSTEDFEVCEGYDGPVHDLTEWTRDEVMELADFMIAQWQALKQVPHHTHVNTDDDHPPST